MLQRTLEEGRRKGEEEKKEEGKNKKGREKGREPKKGTDRTGKWNRFWITS